MALLEVNHLNISFGGLHAVDDFHVSIEKGQLYGLIGPNGAGKTTIFNLLTGVYKPDEGIINLDGQPTYFMTLKDNAGLIKQYAFVSVSNYTNVGTGETIDSALRNFRQVRGNAGVNITTGQTISKEEKQDYIFTVSYDLSNELALTQPGDKVALEYMDDPSGICSASSFDNLEFDQSGQ